MNNPTRPIIVSILVGAFALGATLLFLSAGTQTEAGVPILPLDDSYIHLQYGWQASQGHFLQYNTGDVPTTGATSLLYMLLLAGLFVLGVGHDAMPIVAVGIGAVSFVATSILVADIIRRVQAESGRENERILPTAAGLLGGVLFAGTGWMGWGFLTGMETGLNVLLITVALWGLAARNPLVSVVGTSLAVMTRPEAVLLAGALLVAEWLARPNSNDVPDGFQPLWFLLPVGTLAVSPLVNLAATGSASASGLLAKSWLTLVPFQLKALIAAIAGAALELVIRPLGGMTVDGIWHALPLAQVLAVIGGAALWRRKSRLPWRLLLVCGIWIVVSIVAIATLQTYGWHRYRYVMGLYPALIVLAVGGVIWLGELVSARIDQRLVLSLYAALALGWSFFSLGQFRGLYQLDSQTAAHQQIPLARWIAENTPPDARIAVHDVGMLRYFGGRATFDVVGLTTAGMSAFNRNGPGSTYEALEQAQPDYFAVYAEGAPPFWGISQAGDLLGEELFRVQVEPFGVTSAHPTQIVTRPDWSRAKLADAPQQPEIVELTAGWELVDRLDVADLDSEGAHDYAWWFNGTFEGFASLPQVATYVGDPAIQLTDGGRTISGGEMFRLGTVPGEPMLLVGRFDQRTDVRLRIVIDGQPTGEWRLPQNPGQWLESRFLVPGTLIDGEDTVVRLEIIDPAPGKAYLPFYYWAYQGGQPAATLQPQTALAARFGDSIILRGYDLPARQYSPDETLSLNLYWEASRQLDGPHPYKVFVHLTEPARADQAAGVLAQADSAPQRGVYPFWVWNSGEQVVDKVMLNLPGDLPSGDYLLLLGIYDAATGVRLPIVGVDDFGSSRIELGTISVGAAGSN